MSIFLLVIKWLVIGIIILVILTVLFLKFAPTFGAKPDSKSLSRIRSSPNFNGGTFVNLTQTQASTVDVSRVLKGEAAQNSNVIWAFLFPPKGKNPSQPIKTVPLNLIANPSSSKDNSKSALNTLSLGIANTTLKEGEFVWLGHSTVLFKIAGNTLITDPVFHRASPIPIGAKPFDMTHVPSVDDLPYIDVVLISHDHYDHLDHRAIKQMKNKVGHFYVPLGVKAHLLRWGVVESKVSEYDWYESTQIARNDSHAITVTFTPSRHFSGRGITGHRETLWGGWAVQSPELSVYFTGDGGYSAEFAKIGERFGGFDIAFIEDGAYNERWRDVHMLPEESAQAGIDVQAKAILPIHWGKFDLSTHHWRDPVRRIISAIEAHNSTQPEEEKIKLATPLIGQVFDLKNLPTSPWWEQQE